MFKCKNREHDDFSVKSLKRESEEYNNDINKLARYYDCHAKKYKKVHYVANTLLMISLSIATLIPAKPACITGGLTGIALVLEGMLKIFKPGERYSEYRYTCDALRVEQRMRAALAGPYKKTDDADALFVERCECIMEKEESEWKKHFLKNSGTGE